MPSRELMADWERIRDPSMKPHVSCGNESKHWALASSMGHEATRRHEPLQRRRRTHRLVQYSPEKGTEQEVRLNLSGVGRSHRVFPTRRKRRTRRTSKSMSTAGPSGARKVANKAAKAGPRSIITSRFWRLAFATLARIALWILSQLLRIASW